MELWNEGKIRDFADVKGGKRLPKGKQLVAFPTVHPYIRIRDLGKAKVLQLTSEYEYVDDETQKDISRYIVAEGDILISVVGTIGLIGIVGDSLDGANQTENCDKITNLKGIDRDYLYYYLISSVGQAEISKGTVGAVQPKLPLKNVQDLPIRYPSIPTQRKIGSILSAIDSKIEKNAEINQNLYEQIQAIYCYYFDPVSHEVTGVLSDICKFSTDKVQISDLSVSTYYSTENMQPNKAGAVDASSLPSVSQTTKCRKGDVLISNIRPYFKKIVYVTEDCGCSTDVLCFVPQSDYSAFLFGTLYMDRFFNYMVAGSKGTKMPRGDKQQIMKYPIVAPTSESIIAFNAAVTPMLEQITINDKENARLAMMRDTLLPRLMSGDLDVSEIEL